MNAITQVWNLFLTILQTVTFWDILDIAIIAFLIYKILTFVRKTNSQNVIMGIAVLVAVLWLSSIMHLSVVSYLLGGTFEIGVLALIVLFQPELRSMLEKVGGSSINSLFSRSAGAKTMENSIAQVVLACKDLAKSRTGALIVFEREATLEAYIKTGTIIDAATAAELLKNIFFDKAPMHDGAVIIRNGRIAGAACMLPLSSNNNISRDLGMRHRAGIGISERTDAVVVIVSEETGHISVAIEGMLKRGMPADTFEKLLENELLPQDEKDKKDKKDRKNRFISQKQKNTAR